MSEKEKVPYYTTENGLKIKLKKIDPLLIKRVADSVPTPVRPTYEAKTMSGRIEVHPMDEQIAKDVEGGELQWAFYQEELARTDGQRFERLLNVMFMKGTECELPNDGWEEEDAMLGLFVPDHPDQKRSHYLMTHLGQEDVARLQIEILRLTGVPEETIQEVEASFPDTTRNGNGTARTLIDAIGDSQPLAQIELETQQDI